MHKFEINSIADLLERFVPQGVTEIEMQIKKEKINHPVTIGSMYEGLTKEVIHSSIFDGLNLKIVTNSHIEGCKKEFDVLLVEGEVKKLPFTDRFICSPGQVIAIIQVKKNLYSTDLRDSYDNLKSLIDYYHDSSMEIYMKELLYDAYRSICRKDVTKSIRDKFSKNEEAIYTSLLVDAKLPIRVVWGYRGFASEFSFREALTKILEENVTKNVENIISYFGPHNFPNLVINGNFTMFKNNGMPYAAPLQNDEWPFYLTASDNPMKHLLEFLWTRLSYKFKLPASIFGDDLIMDQANPFLNARYGELDGHGGWHYNLVNLSDNSLMESYASVEWQPVELDSIQHTIIEELCRNDYVNIDNELERFVTKNIYETVDDFVKKLVETGLVYEVNNQLKLLTDQCHCIIHPNGKFYAAENRSGRFFNWIKKEMEQWGEKN